MGARREPSEKLVPTRGLRALVVDDLESSRHVLVEMLSSWSVEAVEASSGAEAIALLLPPTAPTRPFDLVLLDWRMPAMSGLEVARWIRDRVEEQALREPPVVVMVTAFDRDQLLDEAGGLPLPAVLHKPVSASRLLETLVGLHVPARLKLSTDPMASVLARAAPLRGAHILVVEDIDTNQLVARDLLERLGMRATMASDGEQALALVEQAAFDAILMDLHMPVLDGFEATRQLRMRPALATMPILAMTAAVLADDEAACRAAGMNGHVPKPIDPSVLVESLLEWVRLPLENAGRASWLVKAATASNRPPGRSIGYPTVAGVESGDVALRFGDNVALFVRVLDGLATDAEAELRAAREALGRGDTNAAALRVHALRGRLGNVGARAAMAIAGELEAALRSGAPAQGAVGRVALALPKLEAGLRAFALVVAGTQLRADGDAPGALRLHEQAQEVLAGRPFTRLHGMNLSCMGRLACDLRLVDRARELNTQASRARDDLGDRFLAALGLANLAQLEQEVRSFHRAEQLYLDAIDRLTSAHEPQHRGIYETRLATLYLEWSRLDEALGWLATAERSLGELHTPTSRVFLYAAWSFAEASAARADVAAKRLERARAVAQRGAQGVTGLALELLGGAVELLAPAPDATAISFWSDRARGLAAENGPRSQIQNLDARFAFRTLAHALARHRPTRGASVLRLGPDVLWFAYEAAESVDLARRGPMRRMLAALVDARERAPGRTLDRQALFSAGWPGERVLEEAASTRVRVAVATLRKLGLREPLLTRDDGYLLDPEVELQHLTTRADSAASG